MEIMAKYGFSLFYICYAGNVKLPLFIKSIVDESRIRLRSDS